MRRAFVPTRGRSSVVLRETETGVRVDVCDNGPGIPGYPGRDFRKFVKTSRVAKPTVSTGLGLADQPGDHRTFLGGPVVGDELYRSRAVFSFDRPKTRGIRQRRRRPTSDALIAGQ